MNTSLPLLTTILVFALVMLAVTLIRRASKSLNQFLVSNRAMGTGGISLLFSMQDEQDESVLCFF